MHYAKFLALTCLSSTVWATSLPTDVSISVFTTQHYPIQQSELVNHIYFLDAVENTEEKYSDLFSTDPATAEKQAREWLVSTSGKQFQSELQAAYVGVIEGWKLGVMKVPAIVFQHHTKEPVVVYGSTDIAKAIQVYRNTLE